MILTPTGRRITSAIGTKRTSRSPPGMSAFGGKADMCSFEKAIHRRWPQPPNVDAD